MNRKRCRMFLGVAGMVSAAFSLPAGVASAAGRLVVMAVNSGADITAPYIIQPPQLTPGAKGFLIGIDTGDLSEPTALGVQDLTFHGAGLVNLDAIDLSNGYLPSPPKIMTRTEALLQGLDDGINYRREDTYVLDQAQSTPLGDRSWVPVGPGFEGGGSAENYFRMTSAFYFGPAPQGIRPMMYVVTTGDLAVSGFSAIGSEGFDVLGNPLGQSAHSPVPGITAKLDFATGTFQPTTIPTGPGILLGCDTAGQLFNVDPTNGVLEYRRETGINGLAGIAYSPQGTLYGISDLSQESAKLFQIDPATGASTLVGDTGIVGFQEGDLHFNPQDGLLYCVSSQRQLFTIDTTTGLASPLSTINTGYEYSAMAFTPDGRLYALDGPAHHLWRIDPLTGATISGVFFTGQPGATAGMEYDPVSGKMIVIVGNVGSFAGSGAFLVDPATGNTTYTGRPTSHLMSGLAFPLAEPVPEPSTLALAGAALLGLAVYARARSQRG